MICLCKTWLNYNLQNVDSSELLLHDSVTYRSDRTMEKNQSTHDGTSHCKTALHRTKYIPTSRKVALHFELGQKLVNVGAGGCMLRVQISCVCGKQYVTVETKPRKVLKVASGVPEGSLPDELCFVPSLLISTEGYSLPTPTFLLMIANSVLSHTITKTPQGFQEWVTENKMELVMERCTESTFRSEYTFLQLIGQRLES